MREPRRPAYNPAMISVLKLRAVAMSSEYAGRIRASRRDDFGNTAVPIVDEAGGSPCRHCLRLSAPGDTMLLFSYKPFRTVVPYQEVGPVFLHAEPCERFSANDGFPDAFLNRPLILRPYDSDDNIYDSQRYAEAGDAESVANQLLADPRVAYVHARSWTRGCYLFRLERAEG